MKNITATLLIASLISIAPVITMAGTGHDHGHSHEAISETEVQIKASQKVHQLVKTGKIDETWSEIKTGIITQKDFGHGPEWVITFKNDKEKDVSKQTLYIFFSQDGHYIAANFDGS